MKTLWNPVDRERILARIDRLTPDIRPRWGRFTCAQMVTHITDAFALYTGELKAAHSPTPLRYLPLKNLLLNLMPIPRNVATAPELIARQPEDWETEVERLRRALRTFAAQHERTDWPEHPIFGRLSCRAYGTLAYRHTDHHLRQFGV